MKEILDTLTPLLVTLVTALVPVVIGQAVLWLRAHTTNIWAQGAIDRAGQDISAFVAQQAQLIDKLRGPDGVLDAAEAASAKKAVLENLKGMWGPAGVAKLTKVIGVPPGQLDGWLSARIEQSVRTTGPKPTSSVSVTTTPNPAPTTATEPTQ